MVAILQFALGAALSVEIVRLKNVLMALFLALVFTWISSCSPSRRRSRFSHLVGPAKKAEGSSVVSPTSRGEARRDPAAPFTSAPVNCSEGRPCLDLAAAFGSRRDGVTPVPTDEVLEIS